MAGFLKSLQQRYHHELARHQNRPLLTGVMAASALVATADGVVSFAERIRLDQIIENLETLNVFDPHEGIDLFNEFQDAIFADPQTGHAKAVQALRTAAKENPESTTLLIRICLAIHEADGAVSLAEQIEIVTLCSLLEIDPATVGLYHDGVLPR